MCVQDFFSVLFPISYREIFLLACSCDRRDLRTEAHRVARVGARRLSVVSALWETKHVSTFSRSVHPWCNPTLMRGTFSQEPALIKWLVSTSRCKSKWTTLFPGVFSANMPAGLAVFQIFIETRRTKQKSLAMARDACRRCSSAYISCVRLHLCLVAPNELTRRRTRVFFPATCFVRGRNRCLWPSPIACEWPRECSSIQQHCTSETSSLPSRTRQATKSRSLEGRGRLSSDDSRGCFCRIASMSAVFHTACPRPRLCLAPPSLYSSPLSSPPHA